ncbi:hypothetical protein ABPG74_007110 [Tetrahymena malaccensis]
MSNFLKSLDLFPTPFFFNLQNNEQKRKTAFGGIVSIAVFSLSLAYFTYICYLYANNKIDPTVNYSQKVINENFNMTVQNNVIVLQIYLIDGKPLSQLEAEKGVRYIIPSVSYQQPNPIVGEKALSTALSLIQCQDPDLSGLYCFDFTQISGMQNQMDIGFDAAYLGKYMIQVTILICDSQILGPSANCASYQQFREDFLKISTNFQIRITTQYYNVQTKQFEKFSRNQQVQVSESLTSVFQISLQRTSQEITQGFLFQQKQKNTFISDYQIRETYFTSAFIYQEFGGFINILTVFQFQIGNIESLQQVQYPLFTYVLAQFGSVFNVLLILGIVGQIISQNALVLDFAEIQLKSYFKATAYYILKQINASKLKVEDISLSKHLTSMIKILIMSRFSDQKMSNKDSQQIILFKELIKETQKQLSINELQKELMQMKIILRLMLSKEQYAAIQLCGYYVNNEKQDLQNKVVSTVKNKVEKNQQLQNNFHETQLLNNEKKLNQIEENKIIDEKNLDKSSQKYDKVQVEDSNKNIKSKKNLQDCNDEKEFQEFQIQSFLQKNITMKIDNDQNTENNQLNQNTIPQKPENHLDDIQQVENNEIYFEECIQKFLDKKMNKSELDERILGCMIGFNQYELG